MKMDVEKRNYFIRLSTMVCSEVVWTHNFLNYLSEKLALEITLKNPSTSLENDNNAVV